MLHHQNVAIRLSKLSRQKLILQYITEKIPSDFHWSEQDMNNVLQQLQLFNHYLHIIVNKFCATLYLPIRSTWHFVTKKFLRLISLRLFSDYNLSFSPYSITNSSSLFQREFFIVCLDSIMFLQQSCIYVKIICNLYTLSCRCI